jgi:hypothetical protein
MDFGDRTVSCYGMSSKYSNKINNSSQNGKTKQEQRKRRPRRNRNQERTVAQIPRAPAVRDAPAKKASDMTRNPAMQWLNMILDPENAPLVRSPAMIPVLCSKTRFTLTYDIPYANTLNGAFSVIARPSAVYPLVIASNPLRFPSAGSVELKLSTVSLYYTTDASDVGFPQSSSAVVTSPIDQVLVNTSPVADAVAVTHQAYSILANIGTNMTMVVSNKGNADHYVQLYNKGTAGNWGLVGTPTFISAGSSVTILNSNNGADWGAFTLAIVTKSGTLANPGSDYRGLSITSTFNGYIPVAATAGTVANFVQKKIIDTAGVENCRICAMSLRVTNMGSATHDGGEIVSADTRQSNIYTSNSISTLIANIRALPENNRWHSGLVAGGGYSFYVPDDMSSYEPHAYDHINFDDNALVVAGNIDNGGAVRVIATYCCEFYTKSQLFERSMGPSWNDEYKLALTIAQRGRMASGNESHESMIQKIQSNISSAWKWAWAHKTELEMGAELAASLLL